MKSKSKKKGKGKKKIFSEEEKAKQSEMKALAEKEKLVRRQRLANAFLKLKKEKEYTLLKLNDNKLLDLWRRRLRKLKCDELMEDYKMLRTAFERNYGKKDELIGDLNDLMRQNDEEYDNAFDMHLHNIDQILEFYRKRLNEVREMYGTQKGKFLSVLNDEKMRMQNYQEKSLRYLNGVIAAVNLRYRELASDSKAELFVRQEEIRNKALEETHAVKLETDRRMKTLWDNIKNRLVEYDTRVTPLRNAFLELRKKDDVVVATIDSQFEKMYKMQIAIENLSEKDKSYCFSLQNLLDDLNAKKDDLKVKYKLHQDRFSAVGKYGRDNIRSLALVSGTLLEAIDGRRSQRERLLKCIERCRKRERLDEKVDPFMTRWGIQESYSASLDNRKEDPASIHVNIPSSAEVGEGFNMLPKKMEHYLTCECNPCTCAVEEESTDEPMFSAAASLQEYALLERFWIRYNRAALERRVLCQRRNAMREDNQQLKLALRNYMGGLNPLQHNVATYSDDLMNTARRNCDLAMRGMVREWKRRERCRKVGLRVH